MTTLENPVTGTTLYLPSDLSECDNQQYQDVCELIYRFNAGKIIYDTFRVQTFYKLLNLAPGKRKLSEDEELNKTANIYQLSQFIDNFFETNPKGELTNIIKQNYINNHIPFVKPLWRSYYGPTDAFRNINFGEYVDAINLFVQYEQTKDETYLRLLMAIFYRKKRRLHWLRNTFIKYKLDCREAYNEDSIEKRAETFKYLNMGQLYGFWLYVGSFHKYLSNCVLQLNGQEINIGLLFQEPETKEASSNLPGLGLKSIEYQLSESAVFGDYQKVRATNLYEILIRLYDITKRDKDEKARQEAAERKAKSKS